MKRGTACLKSLAAPSWSPRPSRCSFPPPAWLCCEVWEVFGPLNFAGTRPSEVERLQRYSVADSGLSKDLKERISLWTCYLSHVDSVQLQLSKSCSEDAGSPIQQWILWHVLGARLPCLRKS